MNAAVDPALAELLARFDAFCEQARGRLIAGHTQYGQAWRGRDNLAEALPEIEDAFAYLFFAWLSTKQANEGSR